jgi:hypothetical protein
MADAYDYTIRNSLEYLEVIGCLRMLSIIFLWSNAMDPISDMQRQSNQVTNTRPNSEFVLTIQEQAIGRNQSRIKKNESICSY